MGKVRPHISLIRIALLISPLVFLFSCKDDEPEAVFRLEYNIEFEAPAGLNVFETHFFKFEDINTRAQLAADDAGVDIDEIKSVRTSFAVLNSTFAGGNLALLEEVLVDVYPPMQPLDRYEAAYSVVIPQEPISSIQLVGSSNNLMEVMLNDRFTTEIGLRFRITTQATIPLRLRITFDALM